MSATLDGQTFRRILGHYPTGVCAVTSVGDAGPIGMIVGSFTSVSLDPPLVAFLPDRKSTTWPKVEATGRFCVNVLSERLRHVCSSLSSKADNKFEAVAHRPSPAGLPIIEGAVAWVECSIYAVHEAGDHFIAIGQVEALDVEHADQPLLFFKGGYGSFLAAALETGVPV
ncbi:flavin reductase family protein [uncultured Sphingomonas sp.]|uniref:flavin reductase family protein n=1 Tax=uncultured Sphingomonas sp. TaxID=158754 RepID=UPI0035CABECC